MTGDAHALAFARRIREKTSLDHASLRTFICCSDAIAILYQSASGSIELDLDNNPQREQAFFVSIELGPGESGSLNASSQAKLHGKVSVSDLRNPRTTSFRECGDWIHLYLPVGFVAKVQRVDESGCALYVREQLGRPCPDILALAKALEPVLRHDRPYEELFVDNIVLACTHLVIERYLGQRSATGFEHNQMTPLMATGFLPKLL